MQLAIGTNEIVANEFFKKINSVFGVFESDSMMTSLREPRFFDQIIGTGSNSSQYTFIEMHKYLKYKSI